MVRGESLVALQAETQKETRYWDWRTFKSNYNPQLVLRGVLPNFSRTFQPTQQPDGNIAFQPVSFGYSQLDLALSQAVALTGGTVFLNSSLQRFDDFNSDETTYSGQPITVGINQPILRFNQLAWDKKIEPLRYQESQRGYLQELEFMSMDAVDIYFNLLLAQTSLRISRINLQNNDSVYTITQGRYNLGQIGEDELLLQELAVMQSQQGLAQAKLDIQNHSLNLKNFVGIRRDVALNLVVPDNVPLFPIDEARALKEAHQNRMEALGFQRTLLEADRDQARAKGETGLDMNLFANFGFSNSGSTLGDFYSDPQDHQQVSLTFSIPVLDWDRSKSRRKRAEANSNLARYRVEQEQLTFDLEVLVQVREIALLNEKVIITRRSVEVAQKRYEVAYNRYKTGQKSIFELNDALSKKDEAVAGYLRSLHDYWVGYYELRRLTLFDFENQVSLISEE